MELDDISDSPTETFLRHFALAIRIAEHEHSGAKSLSERCQAQITDWQAYSAAQTIVIQIMAVALDCKAGDGMGARVLDDIRRHPPRRVDAA